MCPHFSLVDMLKMSFTIHLDWVDEMHLMLVHMLDGEEYISNYRDNQMSS